MRRKGQYTSIIRGNHIELNNVSNAEVIGNNVKATHCQNLRIKGNNSRLMHCTNVVVVGQDYQIISCKNTVLLTRSESIDVASSVLKPTKRPLFIDVVGDTATVRKEKKKKPKKK